MKGLVRKQEQEGKIVQTCPSAGLLDAVVGRPDHHLTFEQFIFHK
jgi:hypothetical protein